MLLPRYMYRGSFSEFKKLEGRMYTGYSALLAASRYVTYVSSYLVYLDMCPLSANLSFVRR